MSETDLTVGHFCRAYLTALLMDSSTEEVGLILPVFLRTLPDMLRDERRMPIYRARTLEFFAFPLFSPPASHMTIKGLFRRRWVTLVLGLPYLLGGLKLALVYNKILQVG